MALNFRKFFAGIRIVPKVTSTIVEMGDLDVTSGDGKLNYYDGATASPLVTETGTVTLTNKTISGGSNTITNVGNSSITGPIDRSKLAAGTPNVVQVNDGSGLLSDSTVTTSQLNQLSSVGGTIVDTSSTQTLSNKTLDDTNTAHLKDSNFRLEDDGDATKIVQFQLSGITTGTTVTLSPPSTSTTLLGNDTTQVILNKTISTATNSISGLADANIVPGANIDAAKIGTGVVDNTHFNYLQNVTSDIQTQINGKQPTITVLPIANGGTGQATQTLAFDTLAPTTTKGDLIVRNSSNNTRVAIGTDGQVPVADSTQATGLKWATLQQGTKNYITYNNFENNATTGWSLFNTTLTSGIPTGSITAGAANITTFTLVSSGQLAGAFSLQTASSSTWSAGQGFLTDALTIDKEDQAKVLSFKFYYSLISGSANTNFSGTSSNTFAVYIYDVTNSAWIQPAGVYGLTQNAGVGLCTGTFQTTSNSTQYRLAILAVNSSGGAVTLYWDDFSLGPQTAPIGSVTSDWQKYSLTIGAAVTPPTKASSPTFDDAYWRRVGDSMEINYHYAHTSATGTAAGSGTYTFPLPSGYTIDTTKISASTNGEVNVGSASAFATGASNLTGWVGPTSTTVLSMFVGDETTGPTSVGSTNFAITGASIDYAFSAKVPIVGWSSNVQMSNDTDTRVVEFYAYPSGSQTFSTNNTEQKVTIDTISSDTHGAFDLTNSRYVIPVSGYYVFTGRISLNNTNILANRYGVRVSINSGTAIYVGPEPVLAAGSATQQPIVITPSILLKAGDTVQIDCFGQGNNSASTYTSVGGQTNTFISGYKLSGPSVIAATESVNARYTNASGTSITNSGADILVVFPTKDYDSHSAYNTSTGIYTVPVSGKYRVSSNFIFQSALYAVSNIALASVYKNSTLHSAGPEDAAQAAATFNLSGIVVTTVNCIAGDTIDMRVANNRTAGATSLQAAATSNYFSIDRVGN